MLGHGRFKYETPNVIDPGDMPPARPSRMQKDFDKNDFVRKSSMASSSDDSTSGHHRGGVYKSKPPLSRTIKIDYKLDYDEEPNEELSPTGSDDDDMEYGIPAPRHDPSSPTVEQARLFAAKLLSESNRRESQRNLFAQQPTTPSQVRKMWNGIRSPRRGERSSLRKAVGLEEDDGLLKEQRSQRRRSCHRLLVLLAIVGIAMTFGILAWKAVMEKDISYSSSNSSRMSAAIDVLTSSGISQTKDFRNKLSPQYQAAYWLANVDHENVEIPESLDNNPFQFVQRYVLAVLYYSWEGSNWINSLNFVSEEHECGWFDSDPDQSGEQYAVGVTCDDRLEVRNLLIPSNNLKGSIPDEIRHLKKLDFLSLKHNDLSGSIPSALKELILLDYLDFKFNQLTGTIPHFLGDLQRLQVLGLSKNQLQGSLPGSLGTLRLKTLAIDDNLLTGDLAPVGLMTSLQFLYAEDNNFEGHLDHGLLADLESLKEADLSGNQLQALEIPAHIFSLPQLRILDLSENSISGALPANLPDNSVLEYLSFRLNSIPSSVPDRISSLGALTHLDLEGNAFTGSIPASLAELKDLSYLALGKNPLENTTIPDAFQSLTSLRELSLDAMQLQGGIPTWIEQLNSLKLLDLRNNQLTGSIQVNFAKLTGLTFLMLSDNKLTGPVPQELGSLKGLAVLSLHHNGLIGEAGNLCVADSEMQVLTTDCGDIICECCDECCDGDHCYSGVIWDSLENSQGSWEEHFRRADYSFNPHILFGQQARGAD